jgi:hypothetical protein
MVESEEQESLRIELDSELLKALSGQEEEPLILGFVTSTVTRLQRCWFQEDIQLAGFAWSHVDPTLPRKVAFLFQSNCPISYPKTIQGFRSPSVVDSIDKDSGLVGL